MLYPGVRGGFQLKSKCWSTFRHERDRVQKFRAGCGRKTGPTFLYPALA
jgi:hypothetical protein